MSVQSSAAQAPQSTVRERLQQRLLQLVPTERHRLFALTIVIGVVCGFAAVAFHSAIRLAEHMMINRALGAGGHAWIVWTILTPVAGAALAGVLLHYVVPEARGSGIPQIKFIYAVKSGRVRLRDAIGKFVVAVLQIGSGSALGREGPTVQICAGLASSLGRLFAISPANLRRLIPVGAAAGIAAAFNAPIAAVTFTIEEIVGTLDHTVLSGVVVAAALAAVIERSVLGEHPVFSVPGEYGLTHASSLVIYVLLGVAAAFVAGVFQGALLKLRGWARTWPIAPWARPAVGGLITGVLMVVVYMTLGVQGVNGDGYQTLSAALHGSLALHVMLALAVAKLIATVCCYSTGGAGGIFAPVLFIGGMLGGCFGRLDQLMLAHADPDTLGAFALVGMGAFFAAVIRAPITSVLIIFEMTRGYGLVLPLMIANAVAYMLARRWQPVPIYEALLEQDGQHLPQTERAASALSAQLVADAMTTEIVSLDGRMTVVDALARMEGLRFSVYPVLDDDRRLLGLVSQAQLRQRQVEGLGAQVVAKHAKSEEYLRGDGLLVDAIVRMNELGARQMLVVSSFDPGRLVGVLAMSDVMRAHAAAASGEEQAPTGPNTLRPPAAWARRDSKLEN